MKLSAAVANRRIRLDDKLARVDIRYENVVDGENYLRRKCRRNNSNRTRRLIRRTPRVNIEHCAFCAVMVLSYYVRGRQE